MLRTFAEHAIRQGLFRKGESIVVGVSGGADSIALLHLLWSLNHKLGWELGLVAAHLNHQLRAHESDADAALVVATAESLRVPAIVEQRDVREIGAQSGKSLEEAGRRERYAFFERVALQRSAAVVAVAHHADDQAETVLHRILRGTGLRGLAGMPVARPLHRASTIRLVRPLLPLSKAQIREYLRVEGVGFREDASNLDQGPTRNRIRHLVLPLLETQINPQIRGALIRLGEQARWVETLLEESVARSYPSLLLEQSQDQIVLDAGELSRKSRILQTGLIRHAISSLGVGEADLTFGHLCWVAGLLDESVSGKKLELPGGVLAEKRYSRLVIRRTFQTDSSLPPIELPLAILGQTVAAPFGWVFDLTLVEQIPERDVLVHEKHNVEYADRDAIHPPLFVRRPRPGDRFHPLGAPGTKPLTQFFSDVKASPELRREVPVVFDGQGPIWVVGFRLDERVKVNPGTRRVLQMQARRLSG